MTDIPPPSPRAWQRMLSGRRLNILDPSPLDIEIIDIAQGLCRVARWNGQTDGDYTYSVAQHCLLAEHILRTLYPDMAYKWLLACLLHDASEYVIGDMISPFKQAIGTDYKDIESRLEQAVHMRFGLPSTLPTHIKEAIKQADIHSAYLEAIHLARFTQEEAETYIGSPPPNAHMYDTTPLAPHTIYTSYIQRFKFLSEKSGLHNDL